jgi:hypothetical protein
MSALYRSIWPASLDQLWEREAIPLLGGRALVTLEDAARYIQNLAKKKE